MVRYLFLDKALVALFRLQLEAAGWVSEASGFIRLRVDQVTANVSIISFTSSAMG